MRERGKKIDTWKIYAGGNRWEVVVRMISDGGGFRFVARCEQQNLNWHSHDLSALKRTVREALENARAIEWQEFYLVEFTGDCPKPADKGEEHKEHVVTTNLRYRRIQVGTRGDGSKCYRSLKWWSEDGPRWGDTWNGEPDVGVDDSNWRGGPESTALLPATPEVFAALEALRVAFADLHQRLYDLLHPDRAAENLLAMRKCGVPMLTDARAAKQPRRRK